MTKIGIFSGTFDPVHNGHISFCLAAMETAGLDRVVLLPEPEPRRKAAPAPLAHRRAMLELAVAAEPRLGVLELPSRQFTVEETLPQLQGRFPHDELHLLMGSDVARGLASGWPGIEILLHHVGLVIGLRAHDTRQETEKVLQELAQQYPHARISARITAVPHAAAASSSVRNATATAKLLTPPVAAYIQTHQLYASPA
jgi:nicotinate-nucleotide adenylyltransferase